ncbi:MAG: homocysteine S-methyltransferase family protein [Melioribacter sp.]|uniref:homocysteine S-methyltransferase family protein n=1 Tax=Rosettibacter primus TaxID=3111523 RepID=UPI00247BEEA2|nr:homocysteine S-methyltransferase family protein [Melioribacter sp.]
MKEKINLIDLYNQLKRPLILDGAMGSLLIEKGIKNHPVLWTSLSNLENPGTVKSIHLEYINSGADIITTNTFRTNPISVKKSNENIDIYEFVKSAIQLAKDARNYKKIIIAGSNAPAEDCYQKERTISKSELEYNHKTHIKILWDNSVDIIWNETQSHMDEIEIICKYCSDNNIPFIVSLFFDDNLKILSGENLVDVVNYINSHDAIAVGFNCVKPETFFKYIEKYSLPERWGFYFNCGAGNYSDEFITCGITPKHYAKITKQLLPFNPIFIGSCCGSNPEHTKAIKELLNEIY